MTKDHDALVADQFGSVAAAYLTSAVHARGADLDALVALVTAHSAAADVPIEVLDLGCGGGHVSFAVAPGAGRVVAYDLSGDMLAVVADEAKRRGLANLETRQGSAERLPFGDASFAAVVSRMSAHHWDDLDAGLREARRVVKPGGLVAIVDTISIGKPAVDSYFQAVEILRDCSHVRNYTRAEWEAALARAGLRVTDSEMHAVRIDFAAWVARMRTPPERVAAIRSLQQAVSADVAAHFDTAADGSFTIPVALFRAKG